MSFTQLASPLPIEVLGKGMGMAFAVIDYGPEHNLIWVSAIDETGEIWCVPNPLVRLRENWTMGRLGQSGDTGMPQAAGGSSTHTYSMAGAEATAPMRVETLAMPGTEAEHAAFP